MRRTFGKWIVEKAEEDKDIILICGDFGYGIVDEFREKFPDRFINIGLCEQSMIGFVAGLALLGLKPYVYTITPFLIERPFEQIKIDIDINNVNVKLVGYDDYPDQGPTHEVIDDASFMKLFKNIKSYWSNNSKETIESLDESYKYKCPTFIRLKKDKYV